ncbi:ATP-binding protein [bacterium]|nr:ATP-binding protein [bacterium]
MTLRQLDELPAEATMVFMRGPPGVGKTTQAEELKKMLEGHGLRVGIFSTDKIFINADGEYDFVPYAIGAAHAFEAHELIISMRMREYDVYIVDNTHLQRWEMLHPLREAMYENFTVFVWDLRKAYNYGNIHGVPKDKVKMMLQNSDNPYPPHIEQYYGKNQEWFDYIKSTFDHENSSLWVSRFVVESLKWKWES